MKKILALSLMALMLISCMTSFSSCNKKEEGEFIIGITTFEPMNYFDDNNQLTGFETEFAKAVCENLGYTPNFKVINWKTKEIELNSKTIDCIWNGMTINDERRKEMDFSDAYMKNRQVLVVKAENVEKYSNLENLAGASIVAEKSSAGEDVIKKEGSVFKDSKYTGVDGQSSALLEVKSGTADGCVVDYVLSIGSLGDDTDFADLRIVEAHEFEPEEFGIGFRKGDTDTVKAFNKAIAELMADGTVDQIAQKYKLDSMLIKK